MARQTTSTELTARIGVEAPDGTRRQIEEWTTYIRVQDLSGNVSPPMLHKIAYRMAGRPVNLMDDGSFQTVSDHPTTLRRIARSA